jgi:hypothetical protein
MRNSLSRHPSLDRAYLSRSFGSLHGHPLVGHVMVVPAPMIHRAIVPSLTL